MNNFTRKRTESFENFASKLATSLCDGKDEIPVSQIFAKMEQRGILFDDPRLKELHLETDQNNKFIINKSELSQIIPKHLEMFKKLFCQKLAIPDFEDFRDRIRTIYQETKKVHKGKVATYIPQIAKANPELLGLSITTIDGQQLHLGDYNEDFSIQSCCKTINYCIALDNHSADVVHKYVGKEPSGVEFNAITLDKNKLPHNPCTNSGAIMVCSLIGRNTNDLISIDYDEEENKENNKKDNPNYLISFEADRFELLNSIWNKLFAGLKIGFSNSVYLSEKSTGHRNYALGHFMMEQKPGFPQNTNLKGTMEFYFQCCALEATTKKLSYAAATLANGGINPLTGERIFTHETVKHCLSIMYMCGMYDYSGEFAFKVGIPSKSSVSGAIVSIIPNLMGICIFSPPLDEYGNSVRGGYFLSKLSENFAFHHFDNLSPSELSKKFDPRKSHIPNTPNSTTISNTVKVSDSASKYDTFKIIQYAAAGDLQALKRYCIIYRYYNNI